MSEHRTRSVGSVLVRLVALVALGGVIDAASGQAPPDPQPPISGFTPSLPMVPQKDARPATEVASFIDSLGTNDATIEVVLGQGRLLTVQEDIVKADRETALIAVGNPGIVEFEVVGPRQVRVIGLQLGTTDLSVTTADNRTYSFEVQVVIDLNVVRARLAALFPATSLKLHQLGNKVVVEGQARSNAQVTQILQALDGYLAGNAPAASGQPAEPGQAAATPSVAPRVEIINLLRVPGPQQVLLKVQVAELNRTALRQFGFEFLFSDKKTAIGTNIVGSATSVFQNMGATVFDFKGGTTVAGHRIHNNSSFEYTLNALRRNGVVRMLAEPNLVSMNGHQASFLSGGEVPIPVPQGSLGQVTIEFKKFGVLLGFVPYILDEDTIRLTIDPEVSTIEDIIEIPVGDGTFFPVPQFATRNAHTVVELREGQTLAIAGLLQLEQEGTLSRIPGLGDVPVLGQLFSNNTSRRDERELVVLVTPHLIQPMNADQVPPLPGDEIKTPNDLEFYLLGRIEGRTGKDFRATTEWDDPLHFVRKLRLERRYFVGPCGYSD